MALEDITAGSTIADLNTANPASGDNVNQGDDHLRNIKKAVQFTFMNVSATVSAVAAELDLAHKGGTISGALNIKSTLTAEGAATIKAGVSVSGAVGISGALSAGGNTNLGGTLSVSKAATIKGNVTIEGVATFKAGVSVSGNAAVSGNLSVGGSIAGHASSASFAISASRVNTIRPLVVRFEASATVAFGPHSLTVSKAGTGIYRVHHNIGNTNFALQVTPLTAGTVIVAGPISADSSVVVIQTETNAGAGVDAGLSVMLWRN